MRSADFLVVSPTFYSSVEEPRFALGLEACHAASAASVPLLLVDASPEPVRQALEKSGVSVVRQSALGRKGAALREAIREAVKRLPENGIICYQELEKVHMIRFQPQIARALHDSASAAICVPRRDDELFRTTYPIDQYHSEHFANGYLDTLARDVGFPSIDWTFGPLAFRVPLAVHWLSCNGELWDAQIVPMVTAARWHGAEVMTHTVAYEHPAPMKEEEEGSAKWSEKRLDQLNFLFKHVGEALKVVEEVLQPAP